MSTNYITLIEWQSSGEETPLQHLQLQDSQNTYPDLAIWYKVAMGLIIVQEKHPAGVY